eukprot:54894_1
MSTAPSDLAARGQRSGKFRHVYGEAAKANKQFTGLKPLSSATLSANHKFFALSKGSSGGGPVYILPLDQPGRVPPSASLLSVQKGSVLDHDFHPFITNMIATASADCSVAVSTFPMDGLSMDSLKKTISNADVMLKGHRKKVSYCSFNPTANSILASASFDQTVKLWNIETQDNVMSFTDAKDNIYSLQWNANGSQLAITGRDKYLRIFDPRTPSEAASVSSFDGSKTSKCFWIPNLNWIGAVGVNSSARRCVRFWDLNKLDTPIHSTHIDQLSSVLIPYYDADHGLLYLYGKGESTVQFSEIINDAKKWYPLGSFRSVDVQKSGGWVAKRACDVWKCEVNRFLKVTKDKVIPVSFIVPRKSGKDVFQEDIYPDTYAGKAALSADEWISGANKSAITVSMNPEFVQSNSTKTTDGRSSFAKKMSYAQLLAENEALKKQLAMKENAQSTIDEKEDVTADALEEEEKRLAALDWRTIYGKIHQRQIDYIKDLLRTGKLTVHDVDPKGKDTLLTLCAGLGCYELIPLLLNLGSDLNHEGFGGRTALQLSQLFNYYHIEQALSFAALNASVGEELHDYSARVNKQDGIIKNFMDRLNQKKNSGVVGTTIVDIMEDLIRGKQAFSDDMFLMAWNIATTMSDGMNDGDNLTEESTDNHFSNRLWKAIEDTCNAIINQKPTNERDWFWFKQYLLSSTAWVVDCEQESAESTYFNRLLTIVRAKDESLLQDLVVNMKQMEEQEAKEWKELCSLQNMTKCGRQDEIDSGVKSEHTRQSLSRLAAGSASFDIIKHYDYNEYLSKLLLTAHIVDSDFQADVQRLFNPDGEKIKFSSGPVKLLARCKAKAENDYRNEAYPTSAHVLDINRCALTFSSVADMLSSIKLLQQKIKLGQSGVVIEIVRIKNGFTEYVQQPQYADVKLNVMIRGAHGINIIGELQLLLDAMGDYKHSVHRLYSVTRKQEFFDEMNTILPSLIDSKRQLFVATSIGEFKNVLSIMVGNSKTETTIFDSNREGSTILQNLCAMGHLHCIQQLSKLVRLSDGEGKHHFLTCMVAQNRIGEAPLDKAFTTCNDHIIWWVMSNEQIMDIILSDDHLVYKYVLLAFYLRSYETHQFVLKRLKLTDEIIKEKYVQYVSDTPCRQDDDCYGLLAQRCQELETLHQKVGTYIHHFGTIVRACAKQWNPDIVKHCKELCGDRYDQCKEDGDTICAELIKLRDEIMKDVRATKTF